MNYPKILFIVLLISGCVETLKEPTAKEIAIETINNDLNKVLHDPSSLQDLTIDTLIAASEIELINITLAAEREGLTMIASAKEIAEAGEDNEVNKEILIKAAALERQAQSNIDSLENVIKTTDTSKIAYYSARGSYRANNKLGALVLNDYEYVLSADLKSIIKLE